jgi:LysM repeat protein
MNPVRDAATVLVLIGLSLARPVSTAAEEMAYTVRSGQSLSGICAEVYGDKDLYLLVALFNGKDNAGRISPGETLRLPFSGTVTLHKGESLSSLAKKTWGDPGKYTILAWANGVRDPSRVPAGTRLTVPVLVPYRLARGESVSSAAGRFYGDLKQFAPIAAASGIKDPSRVPAGSVLKVPYVFPIPAVKAVPKVRSITKFAPPSEKALAEKTVSGKALVLLRQAEARYRMGNYGEAWTAGHEASSGLEGKEKARALRLMAASQYAFGKTAEAREDLEKAQALDPDFSPDPAFVNPEMMKLYERARQK